MVCWQSTVNCHQAALRPTISEMFPAGRVILKSAELPASIILEACAEQRNVGQFLAADHTGDVLNVRVEINRAVSGERARPGRLKSACRPCVRPDATAAPPACSTSRHTKRREQAWSYEPPAGWERKAPVLSPQSSSCTSERRSFFSENNKSKNPRQKLACLAGVLCGWMG